MAKLTYTLLATCCFIFLIVLLITHGMDGTVFVRPEQVRNYLCGEIVPKGHVSQRLLGSVELPASTLSTFGLFHEGGGVDDKALMSATADNAHLVMGHHLEHEAAAIDLHQF